jgi:hypothetical protein
LVLKREEDAELERLPQPNFRLDDYLDDTDLEPLLPQLGVDAGFVPGDFVVERNLDTVIGLISRSSQRDTDKREDWRRVTEEQGKVFVDLGSDNE